MLITSASVCKVHLYFCDTDNDKRFERYAQRQEDNDFYIAYARFPIHHTKLIQCWPNWIKLNVRICVCFGASSFHQVKQVTGCFKNKSRIKAERQRDRECKDTFHKSASLHWSKIPRIRAFCVCIVVCDRNEKKRKVNFRREKRKKTWQKCPVISVQDENNIKFIDSDQDLFRNPLKHWQNLSQTDWTVLFL